MSMRSKSRGMFTVQEAALEFGTSEEVIEEGIKLGIIFTSMIGRRRLIAQFEIERLWRVIERTSE
jgi:hypothetical protein